MNGIINVFKEAGYTSHDVVARLRRVFGMKRIGHTGTLDPAAQGVLPVCVGRSTVLSDIISDGEKIYEAVLLLGVSTDTYDLEGRIIKEQEAAVTEDEAASCIKGFIGEQDQIPPMYSAVKSGGKKLYELARAGVEIERKPRRITVHDIIIKDISLPRIRMEIRCSKGTYIRSLCHDIGEALGCGGCMESLLRTQVGIFRLEDARKIGEIQALSDAGRIEEILIAPDRFFYDCPEVRTKPEADVLVHNGNRVHDHDLIFEERIRETARMYDSGGAFIGLFVKDGDGLKPYKMLCDT